MAHLYTQRGLTKHETLSAFLFCFVFFFRGVLCQQEKSVDYYMLMALYKEDNFLFNNVGFVSLLFLNKHIITSMDGH